MRVCVQLYNSKMQCVLAAWVLCLKFTRHMVWSEVACVWVQVDLTKVWLTMSSIIVAFSFSFSNSIMNLFNSVILLFVVHPFDVGDALLIATNTTGTGPADYCVVEELSLVVSHSFHCCTVAAEIDA